MNHCNEIKQILSIVLNEFEDRVLNARQADDINDIIDANVQRLKHVYSLVDSLDNQINILFEQLRRSSLENRELVSILDDLEEDIFE